MLKYSNNNVDILFKSCRLKVFKNKSELKQNYYANLSFGKRATITFYSNEYQEYNNKSLPPNELNGFNRILDHIRHQRFVGFSWNDYHLLFLFEYLLEHVPKIRSVYKENYEMDVRMVLCEFELYSIFALQNFNKIAIKYNLVIARHY